MLTSVNREGWSPLAQGQWGVTVAVPRGTIRLVAAARGWARGAVPMLRAAGMPVQTRWIMDTAIGACPIEAVQGAPILLSARRPAEFMQVRSSTVPPIGVAWGALLPASLKSRATAPVGGRASRGERVAIHLQAGEIELAMAAVAEAWLAADGEAEAVARLVVDYLATHPLVRPDGIGALLATLSTRRSSR